MVQPLPTKINLRKRRASEGRSADEVEHFPAPSRVTVRKRPTAAAIEIRDTVVRSCSLLCERIINLVDNSSFIPLTWLYFQVHSNSRGNILSSRMGMSDDDDGLGRMHRIGRNRDIDHSSGAEDDLSE